MLFEDCAFVKDGAVVDLADLFVDPTESCLACGKCCFAWRGGLADTNRLHVAETYRLRCVIYPSKSRRYWPCPRSSFDVRTLSTGRLAVDCLLDSIALSRAASTSSTFF